MLRRLWLATLNCGSCKQRGQTVFDQSTWVKSISRCSQIQGTGVSCHCSSQVPCK